MKSPLKKVIVFDIETGGLTEGINSLTEIAMVAIDLENLSIIDEVSFMFQPYLDLRKINEHPMDEAKYLYKNLAMKDADTKIKTLNFGDNKITLKNIDLLEPEIKKFYDIIFTEYKSMILTQKDFEDLRSREGIKNVVDLFIERSYNKEALNITNIDLKTLEKNGLNYGDGSKEFCNFVSKHTVGNSKPILAGHNIKGFDIGFVELLLKYNGKELSKITNKFLIDTLEMARLKFTELPNFSLGTCADKVGLTLKESHRALPDTLANAKFLIKMLKNLRGDGVGEQKYVRKKFKLNY